MIKTARLIMVTGAARSGKSQFAEDYAARQDKPVAYLATAQALDAEMTERIARHQERRPSSWTTFEEALDPAAVLRGKGSQYSVWLLDCLTLWISNLLFAQPTIRDFLEHPGTALPAPAVEEKILSNMLRLLQELRPLDITLVIVTNEVGWGLVPPDPLSRLYRDVTGQVNQLLAREADEVYLVTVGIPTRLK